MSTGQRTTSVTGRTPARAASFVWVILAVFALVAAACSSGSGSDGDATGVTRAEAPTEEAAAADEPSAGDSDSAGADGSGAADTPDDEDQGDDTASDAAPEDALSVDEISELLFGDFGSGENQDELEAQWEEEERARQQVIVSCMAEQGFEYQPVDYSQFATFDQGGLDPSTREYAETYGLGYTTYLTDDAFFGAESEFVDPNQEYIEGLSEGAQNAFYEALYGEQPEFDATLSDEEFDELFESDPTLFEPQGCEGEAFRETSSFGQIDQVYQEFSDEFEALYERVEADPRIVEAQDKWATCMAEAGFAFTDQQDMYEEVDQRMQPLWESQSFPGEDLTEEEFDALTEAELDELFNKPPDIDQELLAELQDYEITVAVANFDCGGNDFEQYADIFEEYQTEFLTENLAAIQALLAEEG